MGIWGNAYNQLWKVDLKFQINILIKLVTIIKRSNLKDYKTYFELSQGKHNVKHIRLFPLSVMIAFIFMFLETFFGKKNLIYFCLQKKKQALRLMTPVRPQLWEIISEVSYFNTKVLKSPTIAFKQVSLCNKCHHFPKFIENDLKVAN